MPSITIRGMGEVQAILNQARDAMGRREPILKAMGLRVLREVDETFRAQGKPRWEPLKPSTVAAKRQGKGKGGPQALSGLRNSFDLTVSANRAVVFSNRPEAVFHEFGTRGPYEIRPKQAKALALPFFAGRDSGGGTSGSGKSGRLSLAGLGRSRTVNARRTVQTSGGRKVPFTNVAFYTKVIHPGLPARRMLPTVDQAIPLLVEEGRKFLNHIIKRRGA